MAIDLYSETSNINMAVSPRISFSHDFLQSDVIPVEQHPLRSNSSRLSSSIDFDFCVRESFDQESSSAEELFSDGKILPTEIKKKITPTKQTEQFPSHPPLPPPRASGNGLKKENSKESKAASNEAAGEKQSSKSFWRFKRSSSCGSGYGRSLCPLPPLLSRSNSTGSATNNVKRASLSSDGQNPKQSSQKNASLKSPLSSASTSYPKPPLKKGHGTYGNGVRVTPVLNVPPANLFGLGSIFSHSKDKNKKK